MRKEGIIVPGIQQDELSTCDQDVRFASPRGLPASWKVHVGHQYGTDSILTSRRLEKLLLLLSEDQLDTAPRPPRVRKLVADGGDRAAGSCVL